MAKVKSSKVKALATNTPSKPKDVVSFEIACLVIPPTADQQSLLAIVSEDQHVVAAQAFLKLTIIIEAINFLNNKKKVWIPDWTNFNELKYYPWMRYNSGSGFSFGDYYYDYTCTGVGSRLVLMTSDLAEFVGKKFENIYNQLFITK